MPGADTADVAELHAPPEAFKALSMEKNGTVKFDALPAMHRPFVAPSKSASVSPEKRLILGAL